MSPRSPEPQFRCWPRQEIDTAAAFQVIEHPLESLENVPEAERARFLSEVERIVKREQAANSLAWQAYEARRRRRPVIDTLVGAERLTTMAKLGVGVSGLHR